MQGKFACGSNHSDFSMLGAAALVRLNPILLVVLLPKTSRYWVDRDASPASRYPMSLAGSNRYSVSWNNALLVKFCQFLFKRVCNHLMKCLSVYMLLNGVDCGH